MSGYLSLVDGRTVAVRDGFVIGRGSGSDLVLEDAKASRRHLRFVVEAGVVEVEDLGSSNGTLLNGKPVTRRVLRSGDEVQIGTTVMVFREGALPTAAPGAGAPAAAVFAAGDDLFGDDAPAAVEKAPKPVPPSAARPAPPPAASPPVVPPPAAPPPAAPRASAVVEFADEVVEVRRPQVEAPRAASAPKTSAEPVIEGKQRILQYSRTAGSGGVLGDDLGQMSSGMRAFIVALVLVGAVALAFGIIWLVR